MKTFRFTDGDNALMFREKLIAKFNRTFWENTENNHDEQNVREFVEAYNKAHNSFRDVYCYRNNEIREEYDSHVFLQGNMGFAIGNQYYKLCVANEEVLLITTGSYFNEMVCDIQESHVVDLGTDAKAVMDWIEKYPSIEFEEAA